MNPLYPKNYGFVESPIIEDMHYILGDGALAPAILMPNGHGWGNFLPPDEFQAKNGVETYNCTLYGTHHSLATLGKKKFGAAFQNNLSERYGGIMTGTVPGVGNDPHNVIQQIRNFCGVVPEVFLPFDYSIDTSQKYYSPNPMPYWLFATGRHWLRRYKVLHQWLWGNNATLAEKQQAMKTALQFSPIGASVYAWSFPDVNGIYHSDISNPKNHWIEIYDYLDGQYFNVFDSYDKTHKKLDWNSDFGQAKSYGLDFNLGGETLGDVPESVKLPYLAYRISNALGNILR